MRRKGSILSCRLYSSIQGSQNRKSKQEPGGWTWRRGHGGVLLTALLIMACFLIAARTSWPGVAQATANWVLQCQPSIINQENSPQAAPRAHLVRVFPQLRFIFPNDCSLCQSNLKLTYTGS